MGIHRSKQLKSTNHPPKYNYKEVCPSIKQWSIINKVNICMSQKCPHNKSKMCFTLRKKSLSLKTSIINTNHVSTLFNTQTTTINILPKMLHEGEWDASSMLWIKQRPIGHLDEKKSTYYSKRFVEMEKLNWSTLLKA